MKNKIFSLLVLFFLTACFRSSKELIQETQMALIPTEKLEVVYLSPDKNTRLQSGDSKNYQIVEKNGNIIWSFSYDINKFGESESSLFWYAGYIPVYWSEDGRYIYLTCLHNNEDGSTKYIGNTYIDGQGIFRVDVKNKNLIEVIPELRHGYYAFIFTPDGKNLIYADQTETPVSVRMLNLVSDEKKILLTADEEFLDVGSFGISPEGGELFFITMKILGDERFYSLKILDLSNLITVTLVDHFDTRLQFESWKNDLIILSDSNNSIWELNLLTQELSLIATKTPYPLVTLTPIE